MIGKVLNSSLLLEHRVYVREFTLLNANLGSNES